MLINSVLVILSLLLMISAIRIPFLQNAALIGISTSISITMNNHTCNECLCRMNPSYLALNCFPNNTCQFFSTYPRTYTVQSISQARLYFLQQKLPEPSQCCMPNTSYLMNKINAANWTSTNVSGPRCIVWDNHGYLVTMSTIKKTIVRLSPTDLTVVDESAPLTIFGSMFALFYYNKSYYVGFDKFIVVMNSTNFTILQTITTSVMNGVRDMIFLHDGRTLVATSTYDNSILFFNRTNNYTLIYEQPVNYSYPHGLAYVNNSFFYVTSWSDNTVYSYSATNTSMMWIQKLILNAKPIASARGGNRLRTDECGRQWFTLGKNGIRIFDNQWLLLANLTYQSWDIFDVMITDEYVIYFSSTASNRIVRIYPNIQCS